MPGDMVLVEKFEHPRVEGSDEGEILAILEEKNDLVGTARRIDGRLKFVPDDCPAISMQMMRDCEGGAKDLSLIHISTRTTCWRMAGL